MDTCTSKFTVKISQGDNGWVNLSNFEVDTGSTGLI
jgi:hypothetical protein